MISLHAYFSKRLAKRSWRHLERRGAFWSYLRSRQRQLRRRRRRSCKEPWRATASAWRARPGRERGRREDEASLSRGRLLLEGIGGDGDGSGELQLLCRSGRQLLRKFRFDESAGLVLKVCGRKVSEDRERSEDNNAPAIAKAHCWSFEYAIPLQNRASPLSGSSARTIVQSRTASCSCQGRLSSMRAIARRT